MMQNKTKPKKKTFTYFGSAETGGGLLNRKYKIQSFCKGYQSPHGTENMGVRITGILLLFIIY